MWITVFVIPWWMRFLRSVDKSILRLIGWRRGEEGKQEESWVVQDCRGRWVSLLQCQLR